MIQQGDILFTKVPNLPAGAKRVAGQVIAQGETTGHAHRIADQTAQMFMRDGTLYAIVGNPTQVVHEEHGAVVLDSGIWEIGHVQEYDPFEEVIQDVQD